jgi:hypothetical protein
LLPADSRSPGSLLKALPHLQIFAIESFGNTANDNNWQNHLLLLSKKPIRKIQNFH